MVAVTVLGAGGPTAAIGMLNTQPYLLFAIPFFTIGFLAQAAFTVRSAPAQLRANTHRYVPGLAEARVPMP